MFHWMARYKLSIPLILIADVFLVSKKLDERTSGNLHWAMKAIGLFCPSAMMRSETLRIVLDMYRACCKTIDLLIIIRSG